MFYRYDPRAIPAGRRLDVVLDRLVSLHEHCKTWGVRILAVRMTASLVEVETDLALPIGNSSTERQRHLGFDAAESAA